MNMEYSELKERFTEFHAEKITKSELIAAIGLYQRMNHIPASKKINGYRSTIGIDGKLKMIKMNYSPRNISPRIIGFYLDVEYEYEYEKEKNIFFNSVHGETFGGKQK